ncbi:MAG: hypothetical protein JWN71_1994 [Xanthobacteraceae bacterium]|jgi:hypothetical protein|nr:hypothetical protein [Xanthobacteraceae bacterium]
MEPSVVDLKFASYRGRLTGELQIQNHTRNISLPVSLLVPTFATEAAARCANFGTGTLGRSIYGRRAAPVTLTAM